MSSIEPTDFMVTPIRTHAKRVCLVCGSTGEIAYSGLQDRLFGVRGEWTLRRCPNRDCALLWLDPMPIEEDLGRLYEGYYTHSRPLVSASEARVVQLAKAYWRAFYGDRCGVGAWARMATGLVWLVPGLKVHLDLEVFELPLKPGGRLLEVGCGYGSALQRMSDLGWDVLGIDFDENAVELARSCGVKVRLGSVEAQRFPSNFFDAIVMRHVLEHIYDPRALITECRRILKPSGRLVSITPNASSWSHKKFGRHWRGLEPPRHLHIFTAASLLGLVWDEGWSEIVVKTSVAHQYGMIRASRKLRHSGGCQGMWQPGTADYIVGRFYYPIAAIRHWFCPEIGEELILHATKRQG